MNTGSRPARSVPVFRRIRPDSRGFGHTSGASARCSQQPSGVLVGLARLLARGRSGRHRHRVTQELVHELETLLRLSRSHRSELGRVSRLIARDPYLIAPRPDALGDDPPLSEISELGLQPSANSLTAPGRALNRRTTHEGRGTEVAAVEARPRLPPIARSISSGDQSIGSGAARGKIRSISTSAPPPPMYVCAPSTGPRGGVARAGLSRLPAAGPSCRR